jgi:hypothetical protein
LNGAGLESFTAEVLRSGEAGTQVRYQAPILGSGAFGLEAGRDATGGAWLRCWLEALPEEVELDSFGLRLRSRTQAYLRSSAWWDGGFSCSRRAWRFRAYEERPETGYAMTQLLPRQEWVPGGGVQRHDRFMQTFTFDTQLCPPA